MFYTGKNVLLVTFAKKVQVVTIRPEGNSRLFLLRNLVGPFAPQWLVVTVSVRTWCVKHMFHEPFCIPLALETFLATTRSRDAVWLLGERLRGHAKSNKA